MSERSYESLSFRPTVPWVRRVVDYNPCFLLSALSMLLGCRILNDAVNARTGDVHGALWLILTINAYEFCLLAVAIFIHRLQGLRRDVMILLTVGALFMGDIAFVIGDLSTAKAAVGLIVAAVLIPLAAIKVWITMSLLDVPDRARVVAVVVGQIACLLLLPVMFKALSYDRNGNLSPGVIYAGWWLAGALPVLARLALPASCTERLPGFAKIYIALPWLAVIGHLLACTWVFKLDFYAACYAPPILGLALASGMSRRELGDVRSAGWQFGLPILAILFTLGDSAITGRSPDGWGEISPFRLTLFAGALIHLHGFLAHRQPRFIATMAAMLTLTLLGPSLTFSKRSVTVAASSTGDTLENLLPQSAVGWGVITIGFSFFLLGAGTLLSFFLKPRSHSREVIT